MKTKDKEKKPATKPTGRPSSYTDEIGLAICLRLSDGESLRSICLSESMPDKSTVFRWLAAHEAFRDQYVRARELQAEHMAEEILEIADEESTMIRKSKHQPGAADGDDEVEVVFDSAAVARNRLRVDTRKWLMSKMAPKKYSDKLAIGGAGDLPPVQVEKIQRVIIDPEKK